MNPYTSNPPGQGHRQPLTDYELFFRYNRNKLFLQRSSHCCLAFNMEEPDIALAEQTAPACQEKKLLYKRYMLKLLTIAVPQDYSPIPNGKSFREYIRCQWRFANEQTRGVFRQLAREWENMTANEDNKIVIQEQSTPSLSKHVDDVKLLCPAIHRLHQPNICRKQSSELAPLDNDATAKEYPPPSKYYINEDNLARIPIIHNPSQALLHDDESIIQQHLPRNTDDRNLTGCQKKRKRISSDVPLAAKQAFPRKRRKLSTDTPLAAKHAFQAMDVIMNAIAMKNTTSKFKLTGLVSLADNEEDSVSTNELHDFLSELDWDKLYKGGVA